MLLSNKIILAQILNPYCFVLIFSVNLINTIHNNRQVSYSPTVLGWETSQHDCEANVAQLLCKNKNNHQ